MSNTARKARKAADLAATLTKAGTPRNARDLRKLKKVRDAERFAVHFKVGTPLLERAHLQLRSIYGKGQGNPPTRYGLTSRNAHELISRAVSVGDLGKLANR